jgi:hypothetical protein
MRKLKELCFIALLAFSSAFFIGSSFSIDKVEAACSPGKYSPNGAGCVSTGGNGKSLVQQHLVSEITSIYNPIAGIIGSIAILVIIYSAYLLMTSAGEPRKVYMAKRLLFGSGVGIIIVLSSFTIMKLIISLVG